MFIYSKRNVYHGCCDDGPAFGFWSFVGAATLLLMIFYVIVPVLIIWGLVRLIKWGIAKWQLKHGRGYSPQHSFSAHSGQGWRTPSTSILDLLDQ